VIGMAVVLTVLMAVPVFPGPSSLSTVRVGGYDNPPKIYRDADGNAAGFWADLMTEIATREGWDIQWVWGSWSEDLQRLEAGDLDIMTDVGFSSERAQRYEFSTEPVMLSWTRLYVREGDERVKTIPDLRGMRIGALAGSINTDGPGGLRELVANFDLDCTVVEFADYESVFSALENGELDAGITNRDFGHLKAGAYQVQQTSIIFQPVRIHFAFPRGAAATPELKARIDKVVHDLKQDSGSLYYRLLARDFESGVIERKVTPDWVVPTLRVAAGIILAALVAFVLARLEVRRGRRKLEQAGLQLMRSEERYKEIFDSTGDAIFIHDAETGQLADVNRVMLEMYRCTREQALTLPGEQFTAGVHPYTREEVQAKLKAAIDGTPQLFEWHARRLDGELFWVEVSLKYGEFGGGKWVIATVRDIEDRKHMEDELLKSAKLHSLGVLAGGIAHDFNNLLTAVMGNVSMAISDLEPENPVMPLLCDIERASQRAQTLTRQLLTFARGGEPVLEMTRLEVVIRDAAEFVMRGSAATCDFDIPEDLWAAEVDPGQIGQVIQNLVINARQATDDKGHISITCANIESQDTFAGPGIRITVDDDGPGFSASDREHAFDPYYTTKSDGNGLGLAICHSIVTRHGGRIALDASPSGGARVVCDLPAVPGAVVDADQMGEHLKTLAKKVLVMDDDPMVRQLAVRMLEHFDCSVTQVADGQEALEAYGRALTQGSPFDLVIMDLTIPGGMGGKETIARLLELDPAAKAVVTSGYSSDPVLARYREFGFCAAIVKPYRLAQLNKVLACALD